MTFAPSVRRTTATAIGQIVAMAMGQIILIGAALYAFLEGWRRDVRVPLSFSIDALVALMQSKSTIDNGWWWFNPMLSAPRGLDQLAFPTSSNVDQAIVWAVSRLVHDPVAAINLSWAVMVVLSGLTASWCLRTLGGSASSSIVAGALFALSPYALYRNVSQLWMVTYLVPFACTLALRLASGRCVDFRFRDRKTAALLGSCGLLGFNYIYYAFFACCVIGVGSIAGSVSARSWRTLQAGSLGIALIAGCTLLNLVPSLSSWREHGRPIVVREKVPAESEVYGLKIRHLLSPSFEHDFPPFRWWIDREEAAQFPLETENRHTRLGLIGALGFVGLLGLVLVPGLASRFTLGTTLLGAGQLTLAAVLLGSVGGFGSVFSLLVSPQIRAYNRIAPFIAFFSLTAVALALDSVCRSRRGRVIAAACVLAVGLLDQHGAAADINEQYPATLADMPSLTAFVRRLEGGLPAGAMVFQLPLRIYLNDSGIARMKPYDHLRPYVVSRSIRWSYPALSNEQVRWQQAAGRLAPDRLVVQLASEGFSAVLVDRYGYEDNGVGVVAAIAAALGPSAVIVNTDRYIALDVRSLAGPIEVATPLSGRPAPATTALSACSDRVMEAALDPIRGARKTADGSTIRLRGSRDIRLTGWAIDQQRALPARDVDVVVDGRVFSSIFGLDRADVSAYFRRATYTASGFVVAIPDHTLSQGRHDLSLRLVRSDGQCYQERAGPAITID